MKPFEEESVLDQIQVLLQLLDICTKGVVRPYDHSHFIKKMMSLNVGNFEKERLLECCPNSVEVRDSLEFKPYMIAALKKLAELTNLEVVKRDNESSDYRSI